MTEVNKYFDGKVTSLSLKNNAGRHTVGVMLAGEYEFGTDTREYMTLVSGSWDIKLPGESEFKTYEAGSTFIVEANQKFQLVVKEDSAYLCKYQ